MTSCATQIDSLADAATDKAAADQLGFALNITGPIAILAREKASLSTSTLAPFLVTTNDKCRPGRSRRAAPRTVRCFGCVPPG